MYMTITSSLTNQPGSNKRVGKTQGKKRKKNRLYREKHAPNFKKVELSIVFVCFSFKGEGGGGAGI